ncbi:MAG: sulfatase-like hydrolase/transferase [bacterium]|nr:sulfatase-like hydrolase/transferase [bacterium]
MVTLVGIMTLLLWGPWNRRTRVSPLAGRAAGHNVLLITMDTTRADYLGCYGHSVVQTPRIDALAREGAMFTQCSSCVPITLPSHASIMTGTYPFAHRARNNGRYLADEGNVTLAERLQQAGYLTGAEVGAYVLDAIWGIDQGFEHYRSEKTLEQHGNRFERLTNLESEPADAVCDRALEWLGKCGTEKFFMWVHFFDPHLPWHPPERFKQRYAGGLIGDYMAEISFVDEQIGRLMDELDRRGLAERTLVVLTADHGEGLRDHQEFTHTYYVYDATMRVPLIVRQPGVIPAGRKTDAQVRTIDVAPTILAMLGLPPEDNAQGASLLPLLEGSTKDLGLGAYSESVAAHEAHGYSRLWSLRADGWKYIHAPIPELYDVRHDPAETVNLVASEASRTESMRDQLEALLGETADQASGTPASVQLDAEASERLAALGYVGGYVPPTSKTEMELFRELAGPDPKQHIDAHNELLRARALEGKGDVEQAERILRSLLADAPSDPTYRGRLAMLLRKAKRFEEAAAEFKMLIGVQPDNALAHHRLGTILGELGRLEEGLVHLREAAEAMPDYPEAHAYLALALLDQGKPEQALGYFETAVTLDPTNDETRIGLGEALVQQGRFAEAMEILRAGLVLRPDSMMLANNLAWYLATLPAAEARGGEEAVRLAERVRRHLPEDEPALLDTLAACYAEVGRFEDAASTAQQALDLAKARGVAELAEQIEMRLVLYRTGQPFREQP